MRETGRSTRLFQAIVGMGLVASTSGCGGQATSRIPLAVVDAAGDAVSPADASDDVPGDSLPDAPDAAQQPDTGTIVLTDMPDAGDDHWIPRPPVIA